MSDSQPGGLTQNLPKIRKQATKDNVRNVSIKSRDAQDVLSTAQHSYLDSEFSSWEITSVKLINNKELDEQFRTKRAELKEDGRHSRDVQDQFAFLLVNDEKLVNQITQYGLRSRESSFNALGDSKMGVHVCRHADVQLRLAEIWGLETCNIIIFKVILGKCKILSTQGNENVEPTPNFDCHISKTKPSLSDPVSTQAARSQIYLYEYNDDCETVERPRHCIPHAIVSYSRKFSSTTDIKTKGYTSEKSSGYTRSINRSADNSRSGRQNVRSLSDIHLSPAAAVALTRQPSWPARIVSEGEGPTSQTPARIPQRSFSSDTAQPTPYRLGQDQQILPSPGLETVDVYQTRKDPRVRRNSTQELEELSAHDVDLRPNRMACQDYDGRIKQVTDYSHVHFITSQPIEVTDSSLAWFDNTSGSDVSYSSQDVDYRKMYRSQTEQVASSVSDTKYETYSTVGRRLSQGSGSVLHDPRLNRSQGRSISSDSQLSEEGQSGGGNSNSDTSISRKKRVKTQISLAAYKARKKQIEESKASEFSPTENLPVPNINMDVDNLKNILQTMNPNLDNSAVSTSVGNVSADEASEILEKFDRIPDVTTHLANFDVSNLKMILETAKTPTETPTSPGFPAQDALSVKNGLELNSTRSNSTHDESQNTESEQTRSDQTEQLVFTSSLRNKTEDEIIFFPNVGSKTIKTVIQDQSTSSVVTEQKVPSVKDDDTTKTREESMADNSFFSRVKSEGEFSTDRSKIPGLSASPSEESENMDTDLVKPVSNESVSDKKSDTSVLVSDTSPPAAGQSTPNKNKGSHFLGEGIDNNISPIRHSDQDDSELGNISCDGSLASHHTSLDDTLNSSPIKYFSEFHHLTPKQLKAFIESQTQLMNQYSDPRHVKTNLDKELHEEKKKPHRSLSGSSPIPSESSSQKTRDNADSQKSYLADVSSQESPRMLMSKPKGKPKAKTNKDMIGYKRRRRRKRKKMEVADDVDTESISITSTASSDYLWTDDNFDRLSDRSWVTPTPSECAETRHCRSDVAQNLSDYQLSHWTQAATRPDFQPKVVLTDVRKRSCSLSTGSETSWKISSTNSTVEIDQDREHVNDKDLQLDTDDMYTKHTEERVKQWIQVARKKIKLTLKPVKKEEEKNGEKGKESINVIPVFVGGSQTQLSSSPVKQNTSSESRHMPEEKSTYQDPDQSDPSLSSQYMEKSESHKTPSSAHNTADTTYKPAVTTYTPSMTTYNAPTTSYNPQVTTYNVPTTSYNPQVTTYNTPTTSYNPQVTTYNAPTTSYNPQVNTYNVPTTSHNPEVTTYNTPTTSYNPQVTTYNVPTTSHNPQVTTYNTPTTSYNPQVTTYNTRTTSYNPQVTTYNPVVTTYNSHMANYSPSVTVYNPPATNYNPQVTAYNPTVSSYTTPTPTPYSSSATTYTPAVSTYNSLAPTYHPLPASVPNPVFPPPVLGVNPPAASSYPSRTIDTTLPVSVYTPQMSGISVQASSYRPQGNTRHASSYPPQGDTQLASSYPPQGSTQMMPPSRPQLDSGHGPLASPLQPPPGARLQMPQGPPRPPLSGPPRPPTPLQSPQTPVGMSLPPHRPSFDPRFQNAPAISPGVIGEQVLRHQAPTTMSEAGRPPHHLPSSHAALQQPQGMQPPLVSKAPQVLHGSDMDRRPSGGQLPYPPNTAPNSGQGPAGNSGMHPPQQPNFFPSTHQHPPPRMHQHPQMSSATPRLPPTGTSIPVQGSGQTQRNMAIPPPRTQVPGVSASISTRPPHPGGHLPPPGVIGGTSGPPQIVHQPIRGPGPPPQGMNRPQSLDQQQPRQQVHGPPPNTPLHHVRPPVHPMSGPPHQTPPSVPPGSVPARPPSQIPTLLGRQPQQQGGQYQGPRFHPPPESSSGMFRSGAFPPPAGPPGNLQGASPGMLQHPQQPYPNTAQPFQQPRMQHNFPPNYNQAPPPPNPLAAPHVATTTQKRPADVMDWFTDKLAPKKSTSDTDHGNKTGSANNLFDIAFSGAKTNTRTDHFLGISGQHMCAGTPTSQGPDGTEKQEEVANKEKEKQENDKYKEMVMKEGQNRHEEGERQERKNSQEGMEGQKEQNRQGMYRQEEIDKNEKMERLEEMEKHNETDSMVIKDGREKQEVTEIQEEVMKIETSTDVNPDDMIQEAVDMEIESSSDDGQDAIIVLGEDATMENKQNQFYDVNAVRKDISQHNQEHYDSSNETVLLDEKPDEKSTSDMVMDIRCDFSISDSSFDNSDNGTVKDRNGSLEDYKHDSVPVTMKPVWGDFLNRNVLTEMDTNNLTDPSRRSGRELTDPSRQSGKELIKPETVTTSGENKMQEIYQEKSQISDSIQKSVTQADGDQNVRNSALSKNIVEEELGEQVLHTSESTLRKDENQIPQSSLSAKILNKPDTSSGQKTESSVLQAKSVLKQGDQFVPPVLLRRGLLKGAEADKLKHPVMMKKGISKEDKMAEPSTYSVLQGTSATEKDKNDYTEKPLKIKLTIGTPNGSTEPGAAAETRTVVSSKVASEDIYVSDDPKKTHPMLAPKGEMKALQQVPKDKCDKENDSEQTSSSSDFDILDAILVKEVTDKKKGGKSLVNTTTHSRRKSSVSNDGEKSLSGMKKVEDSHDKKHKTTCTYNAKTGAWTTKSSEETTSTESDMTDYSPNKEYWKSVKIYEDLDPRFENESGREYRSRREGSWPSRNRQFELDEGNDTDNESSIFDPKTGTWVNRSSISRKSEERTESKRNAVVYDFRRGAWTTGEEMTSHRSKNKESVGDVKKRSYSEVNDGGVKEVKDDSIAGEGKNDHRQVLQSDKQPQGSESKKETSPPNSDRPGVQDTTVEQKSSTGAKEVLKSSDAENREALKSSARNSSAQNRSDRKKTGSTSPPGRRHRTTKPSKETPLKTGTISDLFLEKAKSQKSLAYQLHRSRPGRGRSTSYSSSEESSRISHDSWNHNIVRRPSWKRSSRSPIHLSRSRPRRRYSRSRSSSVERRPRRRYSRSPSYSSESRSRGRYSRSRSYSSESRSRGRYSRSRSRSVSRSRKRYSRSPSYVSRSKSRKRYSRSRSSSVSRSRKRNSRSPSYSTISSASDRTAFSPRRSWRGHRRHSDVQRSVQHRRSRSRFSRSPSYSSISSVSDIRPSHYQNRRRSRYSRSPSCSTISTSSCRSSSPKTKHQTSPWASSDSSRQPRYSKFTSSRFPSIQKPSDADKRSVINLAVDLNRKTVPNNSPDVTNERKQFALNSADKNAKDVSLSKAGTSESPYSSSQNSFHKGKDSTPNSRKTDSDSGHRHLFRDKRPSDYSHSHLEAGCNRSRSLSPRKDRKSKEISPFKLNLAKSSRISSPYSPSSPTSPSSPIKRFPGDTGPVLSHMDHTTEKHSSRDSGYSKHFSVSGRSPDRKAPRTRFPFTDQTKQLSHHSLGNYGKSKEDFSIKINLRDKVTRIVPLSPERPSDRDPHSRHSGNTQRKERYSRNSSEERDIDLLVSPAKRPRKELTESFMEDRRTVRTGRDLRSEISSSHKDDCRHVSVRKIEMTGDQRKFEKFDSFSLDYLAKAHEKLKRELSGLDGPGSNPDSQDSDTSEQNENNNSKPSEEIRVVSVERKKPLDSHDFQSRKEISDRGQNKDLNNSPERKELPLFRDSSRRATDHDKLQIIQDMSDRATDRRVVISSQENDRSSQHSAYQKRETCSRANLSPGRERSDLRTKDDLHKKDDLHPMETGQGRNDFFSGKTTCTKDSPYKIFPDWKNNPRPNRPYQRDSSFGSAADDWSQSLSNKGVQEGTASAKSVKTQKPGQKGNSENFNELLLKEQMRHNIIKKKPQENGSQVTVLSKGERTVTASNQSECISMCSCSTTIPLSKNDLKEELIRVTRSMEKLWKEPLEQMDSMADRLPKELEEFCIQSGLTQLELENSKVIPQARSAIIRQDVQQFEAEIKMRIIQSNYYGVCSQRVPGELLTKQEENKFFSEEGMFLILCNPIPVKTYQKLSALKKKLDELEDKIELETKNGMFAAVRSLATEKQLAREERKRQLFTFTGCLTKKRLNKMRVKERYYLRCYNYFRREYGEAADEMFPYLKMCIDDSANHIAVMTKLRSEDKGEAAIVEEEKRKEREKIQRQRVLQGLMMDIRTVDSKLSDMYFSCDITENFPSSVKSVVQHVHQRVNSVAEFLSEELMSDEPNSGAVGRLRATHKFCLKAYEFVKKNLEEYKKAQHQLPMSNNAYQELNRFDTPDALAQRLRDAPSQAVDPELKQTILVLLANYLDRR